MKDTLIKLNSIKQQLIMAAHILQAHTRRDGHMMSVGTKTDLENVIKILNVQTSDIRTIMNELET